MDNSVERGSIKYIDGGVDCKICIVSKDNEDSVVGLRVVNGEFTKIKSVDILTLKKMTVAQIDKQVFDAIEAVKIAINEDITGEYKEPQVGMDRALFVLNKLN
jgi:hypothetical protein|tara:strand:- start:327 stop:635 length:309 start_codon:yes stop_codon:yes gene_type:complete